MAEALQKRQTEVEQVWSALREKLQVSVALAEELRRSNRLKSDFLATLVHELRTPLNIILGYIDLLVEESSGPLTSEQADILQRVEWAARELVELITATLAISRLEAGQLPVERQEVKVPEVIEELKQETARLREQSGLNFVWQMEPHLPLLYTDRTKLKIVLKNLIRNALKYTDEGKVSVNICARDEGVEFGVSDTGVGIRPEVLPVIFEMFRQAHQVGTRQYEGSGLGLYIVQRMLELLEGTITVESEVGRGSTFRAWVPVKGDSGKEPLLTEA
jgi:signal transduction histidine kinase